MTAEVVRIPRRRVCRLIKQLGFEHSDSEKLTAIDIELRQIVEAVKILNARKTALYVLWRQESAALAKRRNAEWEAQP